MTKVTIFKLKYEPHFSSIFIILFGFPFFDDIEMTSFGKAAKLLFSPISFFAQPKPIGTFSGIFCIYDSNSTIHKTERISETLVMDSFINTLYVGIAINP
jgi:hypothetical protein